MLHFSYHSSEFRSVFPGHRLLCLRQTQAGQGGTDLLRAADTAPYLGYRYYITHDSTLFGQVVKKIGYEQRMQSYHPFQATISSTSRPRNFAISSAERNLLKPFSVALTKLWGLFDP